jgi:hypothetical protein
MRALFAILCLLLCVTTIRADQLPVIKDSEAVEYVGKNVEVRGLVVSVTNKPTRDRMYQFRTRIPRSDVRRAYRGGFKNGG